MLPELWLHCFKLCCLQIASPSYFPVLHVSSRLCFVFGFTTHLGDSSWLPHPEILSDIYRLLFQIRSHSQVLGGVLHLQWNILAGLTITIRKKQASFSYMRNLTRTILPSLWSREDNRLVLIHLSGLGKSKPNLFMTSAPYTPRCFYEITTVILKWTIKCPLWFECEVLPPFQHLVPWW